jgi:nickel transport protein
MKPTWNTTIRCLLLLLFLPVPLALFAHGSEYTLLSGGVIGIRAAFDTGEVIAGARTLIFAPGEAEPYYETSTDSQGIVCFSPNRSGLWVLQVRAEGGHGLRINLPVDESLLAGETVSGSLSWLQRIALALCVIWALIATALYFRLRRQKN